MLLSTQKKEIYLDACLQYLATYGCIRKREKTGRHKVERSVDSSSWLQVCNTFTLTKKYWSNRPGRSNLIRWLKISEEIIECSLQNYIDKALFSHQNCLKVYGIRPANLLFKRSLRKPILSFRFVGQCVICMPPDNHKRKELTYITRKCWTQHGSITTSKQI